MIAKASDEHLAYNPHWHFHHWTLNKPDEQLHCRVIGCMAPGSDVYICVHCGALRCSHHTDIPVADAG